MLACRCKSFFGLSGALKDRLEAGGLGQGLKVASENGCKGCETGEDREEETDEESARGCPHFLKAVSV